MSAKVDPSFTVEGLKTFHRLLLQTLEDEFEGVGAQLSAKRSQSSLYPLDPKTVTSFVKRAKRLKAGLPLIPEVTPENTEEGETEKRKRPKPIPNISIGSILAFGDLLQVPLIPFPQQLEFNLEGATPIRYSGEELLAICRGQLKVRFSLLDPPSRFQEVMVNRMIERKLTLREAANQIGFTQDCLVKLLLTGAHRALDTPLGLIAIAHWYSDDQLDQRYIVSLMDYKPRDPVAD